MPNSKQSVLVCLTGGGTAGHVMPHLAVLPLLQNAGCEVFYVGSEDLERDIMAPTKVPFYRISTGKLRRYISLENVLDVFKVVLGTIQALLLLLRRRPTVVFSKGGYVSVPVCVAAKLLGIKVVTHESDYTPGLANRIIGKVANKILFAFPDTEKYLPSHKSHWVGLPVRSEVFSGSAARGLEFCGFPAPPGRKTLLVMGGSLGAKKINDAVAEILPQLTGEYNVIHLTGRGKLVAFESPQYRAFEFLSAGYSDVVAAADLVVCRAGANSIFELLALKKPMLLIPLVAGSRGDQVDNARLFTDRGWATTLDEGSMTANSLLSKIHDLDQNSPKISVAQSGYDGRGAADKVVQQLLPAIRQSQQLPQL